MDIPGHPSPPAGLGYADHVITTCPTSCDYSNITRKPRQVPCSHNHQHGRALRRSSATLASAPFPTARQPRRSVVRVRWWRAHTIEWLVARQVRKVTIYQWHGQVVERTGGCASLRARTALAERIVERVKARHLLKEYCPRTVFGRLRRRVVPVGPAGLPPPWWLPGGLAGSVVPGRLPCLGRSGGSSPGPAPPDGPGHTCPSPRLVAVRAPSDRHCGGVVPGGDLVLVLQRGQPVVGPPFRGVCGIDRDYGDALVERHLDQAVPELPGGDARDHPPERPAAPAARRAAAVAFAALGARLFEVEVLDREGCAPVLAGDGGKRR